jgi:RNA polymerase sigma-70 factor (ECF subfamily)
MKREQARAEVALLYETWYPSLLSYAHRRMGDLAQAEDAVQDAFMELYKALRRGCDVANARAWTLTVMRRQVSKRIRDNSRVVSIADASERVSEMAAGGPDALSRIEVDEIARKFSVLTPREEEVLLLRLQALKYREIAKQLGIGGTSVNTLLARALQKLRRAVDTGERRGSVSSHVGTRGHDA